MTILVDTTTKIEPVTLVGKRATLVPMERGHAPALYEAGQSPEIWRYMPARMLCLEDMRDFVETAVSAREQGAEEPFVIIDQVSGKVVGTTRFLDISIPHRNLEVGFTWLSPETWRTRINTECKYLLLRHVFETLKFIRVQFKTDLRNVRSQQAIERLGGVREGVLRGHRIMPDGYIRDSVYYGIVAGEWPEVKARLEGFLESHPDSEMKTP
jgi:RimJ/RimL family protein N-acetyltransferase